MKRQSIAQQPCPDGTAIGSGAPFKPTGRGKGAISKLFDGDKSEPVEKTIDRATAVLSGAAMLIPQAEGLAVGANVVNQVFVLADSLAPDTEGEQQKKVRSEMRKQREAARARE